MNKFKKLYLDSSANCFSLHCRLTHGRVEDGL